MSQARTITAPQPLVNADGRPMVYLGGTIDMGASEDWQVELSGRLADRHILILNPRRADWNPGWSPVATEPHFREQVEWELAALEAADVVVLHLASGSESPISLLELGLHARTGKLVLSCAPDYFRKGNVEITACRYGIEQVDSLDELVRSVDQRLADRAGS